MQTAEEGKGQNKNKKEDWPGGIPGEWDSEDLPPIPLVPFDEGESVEQDKGADSGSLGSGPIPLPDQTGPETAEQAAEGKMPNPDSGFVPLDSDLGSNPGEEMPGLDSGIGFFTPGIESILNDDQIGELDDDPFLPLTESDVLAEQPSESPESTQPADTNPAEPSEPSVGSTLAPLDLDLDSPMARGQSIIKRNRDRINFLNEAARKGELSGVYKYDENYLELANEEVARLEEEIRNWERELSQGKPVSPSPIIPKTPLEKKLEAEIAKNKKQEERGSTSARQDEGSASGRIEISSADDGPISIPVRELDRSSAGDEATETRSETRAETRVETARTRRERNREASTGQVAQETPESRRGRENFLEPPIENWLDLYRAILELGDLTSEGETYSPETLIYLIVRVRREEEDPRLIPKTKGLRRVVLSLLLRDLEAAENEAEETAETADDSREGRAEGATPSEGGSIPDSAQAREAEERGNRETTRVETTAETAEAAEATAGASAEAGAEAESANVETEPGVGGEAAAVAQEAFEEAADGRGPNGNQNIIERAQEQRGSRWWNWFKERAKGLLTFGFWEVHQAEKVRLAGQRAQGEIMSGLNLFINESFDVGIDIENIELVRTRLRELGQEVEGLEPAQLQERYRLFVAAIVQDRIQENRSIEDLIVERSMAEIERRMVGYRKYGGEQIEMTSERRLTSEKRAEIEQKIRDGLAAIRQGQVERDMIKFSKMIRDSLDRDWYKRYVAGGIEAALGFVGVKWLLLPSVDSYFKTKSGAVAKEVARKMASGPRKIISEGVIGQVAEAATEGATGATEAATGAVEAATEATKNLQDNLWNMAKDLLKEKGLGNPTDSQIMEVTKQLVTDNNIAVEKWQIPGKILDTKMPAGIAIKVGGAVLLAARLAKAATGL